jgi:hypothetical protein
LYEISGSHGCEYVIVVLVGYNDVDLLVDTTVSEKLAIFRAELGVLGIGYFFRVRRRATVERKVVQPESRNEEEMVWANRESSCREMGGGGPGFEEREKLALFCTKLEGGLRTRPGNEGTVQKGA